MGVTIHTNYGLEHQLKWADALQQGFAAHGIKARVTDDRMQAAAIHVCQGPHYALEQWKHTRLLYLDRCFYGDTNRVCSIGWRKPDGSMDFRNENSPGDRWLGQWAQWRYHDVERALILADYGVREDNLKTTADAIFKETRLRKHPADGQSGEPLSEALKWADVAIGRSSTALVQAILVGVPVVCLDPNNIVRPVSSHSLEAPLFRGSRDQWLNDLAYTQWSVEEIASGQTWQHLQDRV